MKRAILFLISVFLSHFIVAQEVTTVTYHKDLAMDIYLPDEQPDAIVLFVHGGGFGGGTRQGGDTFCRNILGMNEESDEKYAAITMSYTLRMSGRGFGCDIPAEEKKDVFLQAGREISQAVSWILENGASHGLSTDRIILAGSSAGAEAVLHAAFWEDTRFSNDGASLLPDDFNYHAVISMAGALIDLSLITRENAVPSLLLHGTCDNLVPYASAPHHYCDPGEPGYLMLHGSASIARRLEELGENYALISECGAGHEWAGLPMDEQFGKVRFFLTGLLPFGTEFRHEEVIKGEVECDYPDAGACGG